MKLQWIKEKQKPYLQNLNLTLFSSPVYISQNISGCWKHTYIYTHTHQQQIVSQSRLSHCLLSPLEQKLLLYMNKTDFLLSSLLSWYFIYLELIFSNHSGFTSLQTFWDYSHLGTLSLADSSYQEHPSIDITRLIPLHPGLCPRVTCTESPFYLK